MKAGDYCYIKGISRDYGIGIITQLNSGYSSNGGELIDIQFKHSKHSVSKINVISSPNIIDLIEVGDYVNGHFVFDIAYAPKKAVYIEDNQNKLVHRPYTNEDIYSIVTKEQFSQIEYKVGD